VQFEDPRLDSGAPSAEETPDSPHPNPEYDYLCLPSLRPVPGNSVDLLCDGEQVLPRMREAIQAASSSIDVEMYCFASDVVGNAFARALAAAARRGVRVRVLVDSAGCHRSPRTFFGWMRAHGIDVRAVNPLRHLLLRGSLFGWRDHRKLLVIDQRRAFVGGLNLTKESAGVRDGGDGWHDSAVEVTGPIVAGLSNSFELSWAEESRVRSRPAPAPATATPAPTGTVPTLILESGSTGRGPFVEAFRHAVRQARRRVWIANPYFLPTRSLRRSLTRAARRGVDVRVLVPGRSDCSFVLWASQRAYSSFLRAGVRLFEWPAAMMHAKVAVVDGLWCTIGSYNIDPLSLLRNRELNLALLGREPGTRFEAMFERDFARSVEIEGRAWQFRNGLCRLRERVCAGFRTLF
jgi:cardiolipin synthase